MTHQDDERDRTSDTAQRAQIVHVPCPSCGSQKAVVAATHYSQMMCFCPRLRACVGLRGGDRRLIGFHSATTAPHEELVRANRVNADPISDSKSFASAAPADSAT